MSRRNQVTTAAIVAGVSAPIAVISGLAHDWGTSIGFGLCFVMGTYLAIVRTRAK